MIALNKGSILTVVLGIIIFLGAALSASACEIEFKVIEGKKAKYEQGDKLIIETKVIFTHRNCPEGIKNTKFDADGVKILGATPWKETSSGIYVRKLKAEITEKGSGSASISATRTCDKEGGFGSISLKTK